MLETVVEHSVTNRKGYVLRLWNLQKWKLLTTCLEYI